MMEICLTSWKKVSISSTLAACVDGKNPAPPGMYKTLQIIG